MKPSVTKLLFCLFFLFYHHNNAYAQNPWSQKANFSAGVRNGAVGFSIGSKGYVGLGLSNYSPITGANDFWEYDPALNTWTQKALFPGQGISACSGFSINNKGYVCNGSNAAGTIYYNELWEYDPVSNTWQQKTPFPGTARNLGAQFVIGNYAYVGMGVKITTYFNDFYKYDQLNNSWQSIVSTPGAARADANGFSLNNEGYVVGGIGYYYTTKNMYKYNPGANAWTQVATYPGLGTCAFACFIQNSNTGLVGCGISTNTAYNDFYSYDPSNNSWTAVTSFPGGNRGLPVCFTIGNYGYMGLGDGGFYPSSNYKQDFYSFNICPSGAINVSVNANGPTTVHPGLSVMLTGTPVNSAYSYQWLLEGIPLPGSTINIYTAAQQGSYRFRISDSTGYSVSCPVNIKYSKWMQKSNYSGGVRGGAIGFSIGSKGYTGIGLGNFNPLTPADDFWEYDPSLNSWTQKAAFPGLGIGGSSGFAINNKGYICCGSDSSGSNFFNQLWEYDPALNTWTPKAAFPGAGRSLTSHFVIGNFAYVGMGKNASTKFSDFYRYDQTNDSWQLIASIPFQARQAARGFSLNNEGYIVGGFGSTYSYKQLLKYNPVTNAWSAMATYPGLGYGGFACFTIGNRAYVGCGQNQSSVFNDFYSYDPISNSWSLDSSFDGGNRGGAITFTIGNTAYVGLGDAGVYPSSNYKQDLYAFVVTNLCPTGSLNASITAVGPTTFLQGQSVAFTSSPNNAAYTYQWLKNGVNIAGANSNIYNALASGNYSIRITDSTGYSFSCETNVHVYDTVNSIVSSKPVLCNGDNVKLWTLVPAASYQWMLNGNPINGATSDSLVITTAGTYSVIINASLGVPTTLNAINIFNNNLTAKINNSAYGSGFQASLCVLVLTGGSQSVIPVQLTATPSGTGYSYLWKKTYGSPPVTSTFSWPSSVSISNNEFATYSVQVTDSFGCISTSGTAAIYPVSPSHTLSVSGSSTICPGQNATLTMTPVPGFPSNGTIFANYSILKNGVFITGSTFIIPSQISINVSSPGTYTSSIYLSTQFGCIANSPNSVTIGNGSPTIAVSAGGPTTFCSGGNVLLSATITGGGNYQWQNNSADINGATGASYLATTTGSYRCITTNSCGSSTSNIINLTSTNTPAISIVANGSATFCPGGSVLLSSNVTGGGTYQWQNNSTNINGAINATYQANTTGSYTCILTNSCGTSTSNAINVTAGNPPTVSAAIGATNFCRPTTNNIYSVTPQVGVTFNWTVPAGASIISGQGTASINVSFASNTVSGNVCVTATNACGTSAPSCKSITLRTTIPSTAGTITGSNNGCNGDSKLYSIKKVANAESYLWTPPTGATINGSSSPFNTPDTAVTVTYTGSFAGDTLGVRTVNCVGQGAERKLRINHNISGTPGTITGTNIGLCNQSNKTYSINTVTNALSYTWRTNIVGATINGGPSPVTTNTTSVIVNFGTFTSGTIYVKSNNNCGSSTERSLTLNARPLAPTSITGPNSVCDGQLGVGYSTAVIANTTTYNWGVPSGSTIASGQNSTNINVNFGGTPLTGNVRVRAQNSCASSSYRNLSVTINNCPRLQQTTTNDRLTIQPNPFNSTATLLLPDETNLTKCEIIIFNLLGKEERRIVNPETYAVQLLKSDFHTRIYVVQLYSEGNLKGSVKMVIQ